MPGGHHPFYGFPKVDDFGSLRSLRLVDVDIKDEVVVSLLASCPHLQRLCIRASWATENVRVVDPLPNLKVLEISGCPRIRNLEISVMSLVSCTYIGKLITFPFNEIPNVSELTLGGNFAWSLIYEPKKHSSYSVRLVKLALNINFPAADYLLRNDLPQLCSLKHLELNVMSPICQNLHIFTWLIKASPLLNEFRIKIYFLLCYFFKQNLVPHSQETVGIPPVFPELESYRCCHKNLKAFKMSGYVGCPRDDNFTLRLLEIAPLVETVTIDTESEYYEQKPWVYPRESGCIKGWDHKCICSRQGTGASTRIEAKERAEQLKFRFPPKMVLIIT
ncbi:hypothetical protein PHJA_002095000 [Phtheirospermum japonicum]|uniref:At1g61320/AtMIF1 LRR domain-containing protein n=1 Tax=Phtheirospermum japonicum TaxID=374723 RepID=A0A830CKJ2_9LAMI|nr:hypothetical protein PHJA_002095000 [Phtheirospermum japonicum]